MLQSDKRQRQFGDIKQSIQHIKRSRQQHSHQQNQHGCVRTGSITCPNCFFNGDEIDFHADDVRGDLICECGCCVERLYDEGPERRNFVDGKNHSRTMEVDPFLGMVTHTTIIGKGGVQNKLQQAQLRLAPTETKKSAKLADSFKTLATVASMIGCKQCIIGTAKWYISILQNKLEGEVKEDGKSKRINGTGSEAFATAAIFWAANYHNEGLILADMCNKVTLKDGTLVKNKKVRTFVTQFQRILGDNLKESTQTHGAFVEQIAINFDLDYKVTGRALDIIDRAVNHKCSERCGKQLAGMRQSTLAAACFYKASVDLHEELGFEALKPEDVALCAGIEKGTLPAAHGTLLSHWNEMYQKETK